VSEHRYITLPHDERKTAFLNELAVKHATDMLIREIATELVRGEPRDRERLTRLHRFVRDSVAYYREPVEMIQEPATTLEHGGDCDDHALLLCALAWALKYPFYVEPYPNAESPDHYTVQLGYPCSEQPHGDRHTRWNSYETTIPALPGEHVSGALRRLGSPA